MKLWPSSEDYHRANNFFFPNLVFLCLAIFSHFARDASLFNPLTVISDRDKISPYIVNKISYRQVTRIKKNMN